LATEREHVGHGAAPAAATHEAPALAPGKQALAGDHAESGHESLGADYAGGSLFADSVGPAAAATTANGVEGKENPTTVAEEGFQGKATALPFRSQLERSFGVPLGGVQAHTDENAQAASAKLGANAFASGNRVAFSTPNPSMALVAHELTHVLQHTGTGAAKKSTNGGSGNIETSGEQEAEDVQAAVASGRAASTALQGDGKASGGGGGVAAGQKPALSSPFSTGMTFSPSGLEQSASYSLWKAPQFNAPTPVPGLTFMVAPSVSVGVGGGVNWKKPSVTARLSVDGGVQLGLSYGAPHIAEVWGGMEANASGGFNYSRERGTSDSQSKSIAARDTWSLDGGITLSANLAVGVKLGGGVIEKKFTFGNVEIGKVTGLSWQNGKFQKANVGWAWGSKPRALFKEIKKAIDKAKWIVGLPKKAAAEAWKGMKDAGGWAAGKLWGGVQSVLGGIKDIGSAINPFD